ncbi:MAG TPA: TrkA family potassium uptake protein [bacterium]|jgi:trk system potassium uptake protein TrkA|nr:TrkA family potassium uptake protein [bacterium]
MDFAVIGIGRFGSSVVRTLYEMGHRVQAMDRDEEALRRVMDHCTNMMQIDSTDQEALRAVGITNFDVVVVAIGTGIQESILTTLILKQLGVKKVVSKAINELQGRVLEKVGADMVIYPEREMGERVARIIASAHVMDQLALSPDYLVEELRVSPKIEGRTLGELDLRRRYEISVLLIKRDNQIHIAPLPETELKSEDVLVVFGKKEQLSRLESAL